MEFKGTKGEWTAVNGDILAAHVDNEDFGFIIASVEFNPIFKSGVSEANAQLIASAPELLEALKEMQIDLNILKTNFIQIEKTDTRAEGMIDVVDKWINRNNKAINKSLGSSEK